MKRHLEPLAIAANITQASFCRIDEVLLTFGYLVLQYNKMMAEDPEDAPASRAIIESIESRWAKADQEVFLAAVILNPFYQSTPFATLNFLNNAGIRSLLTTLWTRFYRMQPPDEFYTQIADYLGRRGMFENLENEVNVAKVVCERTVCIFPSPTKSVLTKIFIYRMLSSIL
jgi:hypothetical protein